MSKIIEQSDHKLRVFVLYCFVLFLLLNCVYATASQFSVVLYL